VDRRHEALQGGVEDRVDVGAQLVRVHRRELAGPSDQLGGREATLVDRPELGDGGPSRVMVVSSTRAARSTISPPLLRRSRMDTSVRYRRYHR
jgi:hypothetical protein